MLGYAKRLILNVAGHLPERARDDDVLTWLNHTQEQIGRLPPTTVVQIYAYELHRGGTR